MENQHLKIRHNELETDEVLRLEGVSKKFCRNLKRSLLYGINDVFRGGVGMRLKTESLRKDEFWALRDVSFSLKRGETLGIIGVNGAGKSTLLRILTGIFPPDTGRISVKGRIGGIISLGSGMHPHLTGRENIYLNGAIMGLSKKEIDGYFDEIVDFAQLEEFLEAPFSTYSSGMKVRLGFSVAVCIRPDILLIDEVFSVGDVRFQRKCTQKIEEIKNQCSTIFISHSMRHVSRLCDRALILNSGTVELIGSSAEVISRYYAINATQLGVASSKKIYFCADEIVSVSTEIRSESGAELIVFEKPFSTLLSIETKREISDVLISLSVFNPEGSNIAFINNEETQIHLTKGVNRISLTFPEPRLLPGQYHFKIKMQERKGGIIFDGESDEFSVIYAKNSYRPTTGAYNEKYIWNNLS